MINQYGNQIKKVAYETLENLGIDNVKLTIVDKGSLISPGFCAFKNIMVLLSLFLFGFQHA